MKITKEDIYGQRHPIESTVKIPEKLAALRKEMDKLPESDAHGWKQAKAKCPKLVDDDFLLMFLRCEVFNVPPAAIRLAKYWNKRVKIFGPVKAFQPMTQSGALKGDEKALASGVFRLTGTKDPSGRTIIFYDPSLHPNYGDDISYESSLRYVIYMAHKALENVTTQQKGIIFVVFPKHCTLRRFDRHMEGMMVQTLAGCFPMRVSACHVCQPPALTQVIYPIFKIMISKRIAKRIRFYFGSPDKVLNKLEECGLLKDVLPSDIGGNIVLDHDDWLEEQKLFEDEMSGEPDEEDLEYRVVRLTPLKLVY